MNIFSSVTPLPPMLGLKTIQHALRPLQARIGRIAETSKSTIAGEYPLMVGKSRSLPKPK